MLRERRCRSERGLAEPIEASVICDASASHYPHILAEHPLRMARVTMTMARQMFQLERTIERMSTHRVRARVATVLVELAERAVREQGEPVLMQNQTEIAKLIGTTRESVAHAVGSWRTGGVLAPGSTQRGRPPIERREDSRTFVDELLGDLRAARWSARGWGRFLGRSLARSWQDAARRPRTLAELTLVHLALGVARPGPWAAATWAMAATHLGMLDEGTDHLGWADRLTLLRANLPGLVRTHTPWTAPVALTTDWIDGRLARRTRTTAFGAYADAIADVAFWTWYVHRHETSRPLRLAADLLWVGPAAAVTVGYLARGRALDYPRPVALRNLSVAVQGLVTFRALARAWPDGDHRRRTARSASIRATRRPEGAHPLGLRQTWGKRRQAR